MPLLKALQDLGRGLRTVGRRGRLKKEIDEELRFHLEMRQEENERRGMSPEEARLGAQRAFGSVQSIREDCEDIRGARLGDAFLRDAAFAARLMARNPGFTAVATFTLALGIGPNAAIFSLVEAVVLRPLPFDEPDRLVSIRAQNRRLEATPVGLSMPELRALRERAGVFEDVSYLWPMHGVLTGVGKPQRLQALAAGASYFRVLKQEAALGRVFGPEEARSPSWAEGAVISDAAWRRHFGGDPQVIGRKIRLDYDPYRIIGVLPAGFRHPGRMREGDVDIWITSGFDEPWARVRGNRRLPSLIARLGPGVTPEMAQARLDALAEELRREFPDDYPAAAGWSPQVVPLLRDLVGDARGLLLTLLGAVAFVLVICCATVANLLLARAEARHREFAIRHALGTSRAALVRQVLVESLLLALPGAGLGLLMAAGLRRLIVSLAPMGLPRVEDAGLSATVLVFTVVATIATSVAFGLAPALRLAKVELQAELKEGSAGTGFARSTQRVRTTLVAAQIALSVTLVAGAGLLVKSFWNVLQVDPGFEPARVLVGSLWLPPPSRPEVPAPYVTPERRTTFVREVLRRTRAVPGVEAAAVGAGQNIPLVGWNTVSFEVEGEPTGTVPAFSGQATSISPDFFRTLGVRLVAGRDFAESDDGRTPVVIVDETTARRFWPGTDPLGQRVRVAAAGTPQWLRGAAGLGGTAAPSVPWSTVVGVVGRIKTKAFEAADAPHLYFPIYHRSNYGLTVFLRASGDPTALRTALEREVQAVDADLPLFGVRTLDEVVSHSLAERRFTLLLLAAFALLALGLAGLGVYGIMAEAVSQRKREIGIRVAIGAAPRQVAWMIGRHALQIAGAGLGVGLLGTLVLTRSLRTMLYGTTILDPWIYAATAAVLALVALAASVPATRRAARTDPITALRGE